MPSCKAKFCTVRQGEGKKCFAIPDPKKRPELCKAWIHNLGIKNLKFSTFVYGKDHIVCEDHFKPTDFEENMMARIMGYKPRRGKLKPDAVPTIFKDSKPIPERKFSILRRQQKDRQEMLDNLLGRKNLFTKKNDTQDKINENQEDTTAKGETSCVKKSTTKKRFKKSRKFYKPVMVDAAVQVEVPAASVSVECNITDNFVFSCPNCEVDRDKKLLFLVRFHNYCKVNKTLLSQHGNLVY